MWKWILRAILEAASLMGEWLQRSIALNFDYHYTSETDSSDDDGDASSDNNGDSNDRENERNKCGGVEEKKTGEVANSEATTGTAAGTEDASGGVVVVANPNEAPTATTPHPQEGFFRALGL